MSESPYGSPEAASAYVTWRRRNWRRRLSKGFESWRIRRAAGRPARLLDMPCGGGRFDALVACDLSRGMVSLARAAGRRAVRGDAFALPFAGASFDTVLCARLLHHFDAAERRAVLRELRRVAACAVVTYFGTTGWRARRRAARPRRGTRRGVSRADFALDCTAAGWQVLADRPLLPLLGEQRVVTLRGC